MAKVKLVRKSLNPVHKDDLDRMMEDYKTRYDAILGNVGHDMKKVHEQVEEMILTIRKDYEDESLILTDMPTSLKKWNELIVTHGNVPITIGTDVDTGKLMLVLMDQDDSGLAY